MDLIDIKNKFNIDSSISRINITDIFKFQKILGIKFGRLLKEYLLIYGYIGYLSIEFYGINSKQLEKSDLIMQTLYLHKYYPKTIGLIAFENQGEGDYYLVDENDMIYRYNAETDILEPAYINLIDYIYKRITEVE